jgi:hypothetical protein
MERAYRAHEAASRTNRNDCGRLLLVYAAECGLKAAIMKRVNATDTSKIPTEKQIGHDLRGGLKELRAPAALRVNDTRTTQPEAQEIPPKRLHEAFRYGVGLDQSQRTEGELEAILVWLGEELQ